MFRKKFFVAFLLCLVSLASFGVAFARSLDSQPSSPTFCTVSGNPGCSNTAAATVEATTYAGVLTSLNYAKGYCFFDGSFSVNTHSCDSNVKPPPATPFPGCSDVNTGGVLSPNLKSVASNGGTGYLFQSQACGTVWAGFDDQAGTHYVYQVTIREQDNSRLQQAYLAPRTANTGDWTSTYMLSYVPGHTYCADFAVDGNTFTTCALV